MRDVTERFLSAVQGSNAPLVTANIWLDGRVVREAVRVVGGQVGSSAAGIVESSLSLQFAQTVALADVDDLHAYGMQVNVLAGFDLEGSEELVSLGWFEIKEVSVRENWVWPDWFDALSVGDQDALKLSTVYSLECEDLMSVLAGSDFLAPIQPSSGVDAWTTIRNLCAGIVSVVDPGFAVKALPAGLVFEWSRLDAIKQIAALWDGAFPVITSDGQLTLMTEDGGDTAPALGVKLNIEMWERSSDTRGLKNAVTFLGKTADGKEIVGYATEASGAAQYGGPFGFRPARHSSDLMTTQAMVDAAAASRLTNMIARRSVSQSVSALWNPAYELRDQILLSLPNRAPVLGVVTGLTFPLLGGPMRIELRLPLWI